MEAVQLHSRFLTKVRPFLGGMINIAQTVPVRHTDEAEDARDVVIVSYTIVGSIKGMGQSIVQVEAREIVIPDRNVANYSMRVEFSFGGDYPQTSIVNIEYSELDRLIAMLKKLETTVISTNRFALSEVQYEIGDLKIIVFNTTHGSTMAAISVNGTSAHLSSAAKLSGFTKLVEDARTHIESNKIF